MCIGVSRGCILNVEYDDTYNIPKGANNLHLILIHRIGFVFAIVDAPAISLFHKPIMYT